MYEPPNVVILEIVKGVNVEELANVSGDALRTENSIDIKSFANSFASVVRVGFRLDIVSR